MDSYTLIDYRMDREFAKRAAIAIPLGLDEMVEVLQTRYERLRTGPGDDFTEIGRIKDYNEQQIFAVLMRLKNRTEDRMAGFRDGVYAPLDSDLDRIVEAYKFAKEDDNQRKRDEYGFEARNRLQGIRDNKAELAKARRKFGVLIAEELLDYGQERLELQKA